MSRMPRPTQPVGLYDPSYEHDACGVAFVARLDGKPTHETVQRAVVALENLEHRGAAGADPNTGDGAGILLQMPDAFMRAVLDEDLPPPGRLRRLRVLPAARARAPGRARGAARARRSSDEGQRVVAWRDVPVDKDYVGITANFFAPYVKQLVVAASDELAADQDAFERKLYVIRRVAEIAAGPDLVIPSFSSRTIVYKGMLTSPQLLGYYPDLQDERFASALGLVHSRFSTNTFPSWELAHPYRMIAHNGEINTLRGNVNWMRARESQLASELFGDDLQKVLPIVRPGGSDSATFDNVLELLVLAGRSLPHAVMMMIPEAYDGRDDLPEHLRGFYAFHSCLMEPWDGPAAVAFTDGRVIGATLDRNGLRPGRWLETKDGWVVLALGDRRDGRARREHPAQGPPAARQAVPRRPRARARSSPTRRSSATSRPRRPTASGSRSGIVHLGDLPEREPYYGQPLPLRERQLAFGYSQEDLRVLLAPIAAKGEEPIGSMGNDQALAVLSDRQPPLFNYFKQLFAQVTNPPIDPIREAIVMSVGTGVGSERNLLDEAPEHARQLAMKTPILRNGELEKLRQVDSSVFSSRTLDITWPVDGGRGRARGRRRPRLRRGERGARRRHQRPDPLRPRARPRAGADPVAAGGRRGPPPPRPQGHAPADRPRARVRRAARGAPLRHADRLRRQRDQPVPDVRVARRARRATAACRTSTTSTIAETNVVKGIAKGLLKTISKMGISTIQSYNGAQIFEAVGLGAGDRRPRVRRHRVAHRRDRDRRARPQETLQKHARAYPAGAEALLPVGGVYAWRREGEHHMWNPETIALLQHSVRHGGRPTYEEYAKLVNEDAARARDAARAAALPGAARGPVAAARRGPARRRRSSSASRPARCRSARSRARRTRRSRSR